MALESAIAAAPLEKFCAEDEMSDEDPFISLRLSDEDEDSEKNETQKTEMASSALTAEAEDEILNKFDTSENVSDCAIDEDALLNEKHNEPVLEEQKTEEPTPPESCDSEEKKDEENVTKVGTEPDVESSKTPVEAQAEDEISSSLSATNSVSKDVKDTMDTEDLLQVTSVKEADGSNENSDSSEKDESEDVTMDDCNEREEDDNEELADRPAENGDGDCGDVMDFEENTIPLSGEVSEEMDKDYENLLNTEKENAEKEEAGQKSNGEKVEDDLIADGSKVDENKQICSEVKVNEQAKDDEVNSSSEKDAQCVSSTKPTSDDDVFVTDEQSKENTTKLSNKRTLSDCETEVGSKKIRLTESQSATEKKIVILQTLTDFIKTKSLKKLTRRDLEEFCIQKMCEVLIHKSEIGELRHQLQSQEQMMEFWKKETTSMSKQVKDLEIVNKKMLNELKMRDEKNTPLVPVKITRSVGLQVRLDAASAKRLTRIGSEVPHSVVQAAPTKSIPANNNIVKSVAKSISPQVTRQNNKDIIKQQAAPLLSQALTKDSQTSSNAAAKGVIDLTDEDDKAPNPAYANGPVISVAQTKPASSTVRATMPGIALVTTKPTTAGGATSTPPRVMYVLQPTLPQADLGKPGATAKAVMFKLNPSGNGIIPTLQNGTTPIAALNQPALRANQVKLQTPASTSPNLRSTKSATHPAPLPPPPIPSAGTVSRKMIPPQPQLSIRKSGQGIVLSWKLPLPLDNYEVIAGYQLYAYQETSSPPSSDMWRKVGDVKALALPMACTLTQFADGNRYYFAVRAVDVHKRIGPFSEPEPISL